MAMTNEVDAHQPFTVGNASSREERIDRPFDLSKCLSDRVRTLQVDFNGLMYVVVDRCAVKDDDFRAERGRALRRRRSHSGSATNHHRSLTVISERVSSSHGAASLACLRASRWNESFNLRRAVASQP